MTSPYDPGRLALALGDLEEELRHWCSAAAAGLADALFDYRRGQEEVDQLRWRADLARGREERDQDCLQEEQELVALALNRTRDAVRTAEWTDKQVGEAQRDASDTLQFCHQELRKALDWLRRAEERLDQALKWLAQAQAKLAAAQHQLSAAESALRN